MNHTDNHEADDSALQATIRNIFLPSTDIDRYLGDTGNELYRNIRNAERNVIDLTDDVIDLTQDD